MIRPEGIYYNELETRVRLSKRRQKMGQTAGNTRLIVRHRTMDAAEFRMQRFRERQLEPPGEDDEEMEMEMQEDLQNEANEVGVSDKDESDREASDREEEKEEEEEKGNESDGSKYTVLCLSTLLKKGYYIYIKT